MRKLVNASDLSNDPTIADWLFESAALDERDPLNILLQREAEAEEEEYYSDLRRPRGR